MSKGFAALEPLYAPWEEPNKHRVKGVGIVPGRRASRTVLAPYIRSQVSDWRHSGYEGASETTKTLLNHWFETAHEDDFRYHFCQREAVETIIWLAEVKRYLIPSDLFSSILPEEDKRYTALTNIKPEDDLWARYCSKLATGAGKTKCMSLVMAWSYFHSLYESNSIFPRHFVVVAPNLIVFDRLKDDFESAKIFYSDPILPPEFRDDFNVQVVMQDDSGAGSYQGTIYLTNIHRLFPKNSDNENSVGNSSLLGPTVNKNQVFKVGEVLRNRISAHPSVMILNDEAHHLHDPESAWNEAIDAIHHQSLTKGNRGVVLQADFTATPKHNNGDLFRHIVSDFPLGEAVDAGIVKVPVIGRSEEIKANDAAGDAFEKYRTHLLLGYQQYQYMWEEWSKVRKPILFVMCETAQAANEIAAKLNNDERFPLLNGKVLNLHTRLEGKIVTRNPGKNEWKEFVYSESKLKDDDLKEIRRWSADLDKAESPYRCVVSVLMLREGWDVRNVTTIVPLRPYTAKSNILAEQTLGRGLRRMERPGPDAAFERVTVVEHPSMLALYNEELEQEGLEIGEIDLDERKPQTVPIFIDPKKDAEKLDIVIPQVSDSIETTVTLNEIKFEQIEAQFKKISSGKLPVGKAKDGAIKFEERTLFTDEVVKSYEIDRGLLAQGYTAVSVFVKVLERACRLQGSHATLSPLVQRFIEETLFDRKVNLYQGEVDHRLGDIDVREHIEATFAPLIKSQTNKETKRKKQSSGFALSSWRAFQATQSQKRPCDEAEKTIFNLVACSNYFEAEFAAFCDDCLDVVAFAKNTGPQKLAIDYLSMNGRPSLYWPDFFVKSAAGINYLVETKGQEDTSVALKAKAAIEWCKAATHGDQKWEYAFIPQYLFDQNTEPSLEGLLRACEPKKKALLESLKSAQLVLPLEATSGEIRAQKSSEFLGATDVSILPDSILQLVNHSIVLLDYDKRMQSPRYGACFQTLLEALENLCGASLISLATPFIPQNMAEHKTFFEPYYAGSNEAILRDQGRKLRRNVVDRGRSNLLGNFLFMLGFSRQSKFDSVSGIALWDSVRLAFGKPEFDGLYDQLSTCNNFRNKYIAHGDTPLTDPKVAEENLHMWIECIIRLFEVTKSLGLKTP
ncbi:MAG: DEAD/DEAH box helicase family protein [Armatimonadota bacterium]